MPAGFQPLELESSSLLPKGGSAPRSCEPEDLQHDKVGGVQVRCSGRTRPRAQQAAAAATPPAPLVPACQHLRGLGDALHSIPHALPHHLQDIAGFQGYRASLPRQLLFALLCVVTGGALFVASRWWLRLRVALTLAPCPLAQADWVVVTVRWAGCWFRSAGLAGAPSHMSCCRRSLQGTRH